MLDFLLRGVILLLEAILNYLVCFAPEWLQLATGAWTPDNLISSYESNISENFVSLYQMQRNEVLFLKDLVKTSSDKI